jgi:hypothetical protein
VTADVSDRAGNAATQATRTVSVDATPPTVAIGSIAGDDVIDAVEHNQPLTIRGTTTSVEDGRTVTLHLNGHDYTATVSGNTWSTTVGASDVVALADPTYTVRADVADRAGNPAVETSRVVAVNTTVGIGTANATTTSPAAPVPPPVAGSLPPSVVVTAPASLLTSVFAAPSQSRDVTALAADRGITLPDLPATSIGLVVKGTDPSLPGEQGLYLTRTPSSQESLVNEISSFNLPNGMFRHSDASAVVKVEANLADGRPLPDWMTFDAESGRFTAKPPQGSGGYMDIKVTARDQNGNMVSAQFLFHITEPKSGRSTAGDASDKAGTSDDATQKTTPRDGAAGQDNGAPGGARPGPRSDAREPAHAQRHAGRHFRGRPSLAEQMADQRGRVSTPAGTRQAAPRQGTNA